MMPMLREERKGPEERKKSAPSIVWEAGRGHVPKGHHTKDKRSGGAGRRMAGGTAGLAEGSAQPIQGASAHRPSVHNQKQQVLNLPEPHSWWVERNTFAN